MKCQRWNAVCGENRTHGVEWGKGGDYLKSLPITKSSRVYCPFRQATELWVECRLDAINLDIIARLMKYEPDKWCEVTVSAVGDMVFVLSSA